MLELFTPEERELLCANCEMCCIYKVKDNETGEILLTKLRCSYLDVSTGKCSVYADRTKRNYVCMFISDDNMEMISRSAPKHCGYRCVYEKRKLPSWHPIFSDESECAKKLLDKLSNICVREWDDDLTPDDIKKTVQDTTALNEAMEL